MEMKSNKTIRKCERKQRRAQHRLARDMKIDSSEEPRQYIAIANAGLTTGLRRESIEQFIRNIVQSYQVTMPPGKSYCFINFFNIENAKNFYNKVHGILKVPDQNTVFYLLYVKAIPHVEETLGDYLPPGLRLITDFISVEEELLLLQSINWDEEEENKESELKHRKVKHFGYKFRYDNNLVDTNNPISAIPQNYEFLQNLFEKHGCGNHKYDQITVNKYSSGQGIPPHIDTHSAFEDPILSLSLKSAYVMEFKKGDKKFALDLPARSLLIMSGEARYAWSHGICPRHTDNIETQNGFSSRLRCTRVSFTFRKTRKGDCKCNYKKYCDSNKPNSNATLIDDFAAVQIENSYVHEVYEQISSHFNETRHKQWPNVTKFIESIETGGVLLDVGCGNGKYLHGQPNIYKMGCDRSTGLVEICHKRGFEIVLADCLHLLYKSNILDSVLCIAVIHHLSTIDRRKRAISEIMRVLKIGGKALIYVWAKEQNKDSIKSTYLRFNAHKHTQEDKTVMDETEFYTTEDKITLPVHKNRTEFKHSDMLVPWKRKDGGEFLRYYHLFENGELEELCANIPSTEVKNSYYDQGNWCVELRKICK